MTTTTMKQQQQQQQQRQKHHFAFVAKILFAICLCGCCHGFSFAPKLTTNTKTTKKTVEAQARWWLSSSTTTNRQRSLSHSHSTSTTLFVATDFIEKKTATNDSKQSTSTSTTRNNNNSKQQQPPPTQPLSKNQEALKLRKFPRTWVPLASVYELDPDRPTPLEFLGQKFVGYKQTPEGGSIEDDWIVVDDACPHRSVPLSEGRIERNSTAFSNHQDEEATTTESTTTTTSPISTIQCSYHGWEFDGRPQHGNGACVRIPQVSPEQETAALRSQKARVRAYSVRVYKNVLWFWPWPDVDVVQFALQHYPEGHPEGIMETIARDTPHPTTYTRDLPYGWDTLLENLIDPAHIPFAHHNLQGKRDDAIPIEMTVPESLGGFGELFDSSLDSERNGHNSTNGNGHDSTHNDLNNHRNGHDSNGHNAKPDTASGTSSKRLGEAGFFFEWQDRTMGKHRGGIAEFKAPYGIGYEGFYYPSKEEADTARGTHVANKRKTKETKQTQKQPSLLVSSNDDSGETETKDQEKEELRVFQLGVLCIPTKPGWSRAIIMAGGSAKQPKQKQKPKQNDHAKDLSSISNANAQLESTTTNAAAADDNDNDTETETENAKPKKKKKKSLIMIIFGLLPPWIIHTLSNKFLDSDLAFLHYQEQERLRHSSSSSNSNHNNNNNNNDTNNHGYYMPAQADRCIAALRQWLPLYTDYLGGGPTNRTYTLPPPITDRTQLFDRYHQHTSHCKHCQTGLEIVTNKIPKMAKLGIVVSLLVSHVVRTKALYSLLAKMVALSCWGLLGLLRKIEPAFKVGEFKHYQNH